jgi:hypothetical protein
VRNPDEEAAMEVLPNCVSIQKAGAMRLVHNYISRYSSSTSFLMTDVGKLTVADMSVCSALTIEGPRRAAGAHERRMVRICHAALHLWSVSRSFSSRWAGARD